MKIRNEDKASPNGVLATILIAVCGVCFLCGKSLWVPASRVGNLHLRSILLASADAISALVSPTGADTLVPAARARFVAAAGLSGNVAWDARYYNTRLPDSGAGQGGDAASIASATGFASSGANAVVGSQVAPGCLSAPSGSSAELSPSDGLASINANTSPDGIESPGAVSPGSMGSVGAASSSSPVNSAIAVSLGNSPARGIERGVDRSTMIHSRENPLRVYMFGDSQVFSLGSGLSRLAGADSPISVDFLPVHSTGFVRGDYFNWSAKLEDTFRQSSYDAAVMMLGMNDYQSFWNDRGVIMKKETPEWEAAYKDKCRKLIDIALASVPRVYWIGMPVVKNAAYGKNLAYIDAVQRSLVEEYSPDVLVRVPLDTVIPGPGKPWTANVLTRAGNTVQVMAADGSHFTVEGGQFAMQPLFNLLCSDYLFSEVPVAHLPE